ncbi:MAG: FMN-binding protein [Gammaproteobacteria bacterium]
MTSNRPAGLAGITARLPGLLLAGLLLVSPLSSAARGGGDYGPEISQREAQQQAFGKDASFREMPRDEIDRLAKAAGRTYAEYINTFRIKIWRASVDGAPAGYFATDAVIGKVEKIDYAVALDNAGKVQQVFILKYRESHGQEVKRADWLAQFRGKGAGDPLRLKQDIDNITGATLSCDHLTDGIRKIARILAGLAGPSP